MSQQDNWQLEDLFQEPRQCEHDCSMPWQLLGRNKDPFFNGLKELVVIAEEDDVISSSGWADGVFQLPKK